MGKSFSISNSTKTVLSREKCIQILHKMMYLTDESDEASISLAHDLLEIVIDDDLHIGISNLFTALLGVENIFVNRMKS